MTAQPAATAPPDPTLGVPYTTPACAVQQAHLLVYAGRPLCCQHDYAADENRPRRLTVAQPANSAHEETA